MGEPTADVTYVECVVNEFPRRADCLEHVVQLLLLLNILRLLSGIDFGLVVDDHIRGNWFTVAWRVLLHFDIERVVVIP